MSDPLLYAASNKIIDPNDWVVDFYFESGQHQRIYVWPSATEAAAIKSAHALARHMLNGIMPVIGDMKINRRYQIDPNFSKTKRQSN